VWEKRFGDQPWEHDFTLTYRREQWGHAVQSRVFEA
jgi:hypothetical protein